MARPAVLVGVLVAGVAVGGCASYRTVDLPWVERPTAGEFATRSDMRAGDRLRVTGVRGEVTEGLLVAWDAQAVTLADTTGGVRLLNVPTDDIVRIEVWDREPGRRLAAASLAVAGTALTILFVDEILDDDVEPNHDWAPAAAAR